jgi:hypothetical protein
MTSVALHIHQRVDIQDRQRAQHWEQCPLEVQDVHGNGQMVPRRFNKVRPSNQTPQGNSSTSW